MTSEMEPVVPRDPTENEIRLNEMMTLDEMARDGKCETSRVNDFGRADRGKAGGREGRLPGGRLVGEQGDDRLLVVRRLSGGLLKGL